MVVAAVAKGSIASRAGIAVGDHLLSIDGQSIKDIIDYRYLIAEEELELSLLTEEGRRRVSIEKGYDEDLGISFASPTIDRLRRCTNRCIFCFVDQLPPHLRSTLYFKDEDYRLSFLEGSYITLTSITKADLERIIRFRLSPLYISVHATEGKLREMMIGNPRASLIKEQLRCLTEAGIELHTQVIVCPGINDGSHLERTISDLVYLSPPQIRSLAIVPVGLTRFRQGLFPLRKVNKEEAERIIEQVSSWQRSFRRELGSNFVFLADEFYLMAQEDVPDYEHYEDFPQVENGVGITRLFSDEWRKVEKELPGEIEMPIKVAVVTGESASGILKMVADRLNLIAGLEVDLLVVKNRFFGDTVTVAGLLTGQDIAEAANDRDLGDLLLIPKVALKRDEDIFLDDLSLEDLEGRLNLSPQRKGKKVKVRAVPPTPSGLLHYSIG